MLFELSYKKSKFVIILNYIKVSGLVSQLDTRVWFNFMRKWDKKSNIAYDLKSQIFVNS